MRAERDTRIHRQNDLSLVSMTLGVMGHPPPYDRNPQCYLGETDNHLLLDFLNHFGVKVVSEAVDRDRSEVYH